MKRMKTLLLCIFVLTAIAEKANSGKSDIRLQGYVTDAVTKKPVSGVLVSATGPGITSTTEATTDAEGYFSFAQLSGSQVSLQLIKKGYLVYKRNNIAVKERNTIRLSVEFIPENIQEELDESEYPILRILQLTK